MEMLTLRAVNSVIEKRCFSDLCKPFTLLIVVLGTLNILNTENMVSFEYIYG